MMTHASRRRSCGFATYPVNAALLDDIDRRLKEVKISIRNAPLGQSGAPGKPCIFTGRPAVEEVIVGRAY